jgi:hypothetical protein
VHCQRGDEAAYVVAALGTLDISWNPIRHSGLRALASLPFLASVKLDWTGCRACARPWAGVALSVA